MADEGEARRHQARFLIDPASICAASAAFTAATASLMSRR
jgi:hypothetical protein